MSDQVGTRICWAFATTKTTFTSSSSFLLFVSRSFFSRFRLCVLLLLWERQAQRTVSVSDVTGEESTATFDL